MIIGELSTRSGVSPRSLRYYEQLGLVSSTRASNGYRHYHDDAVAIVRTIRSAFDLGFLSDTVRVILTCATGDHEGVDRQGMNANVQRMRDDIADRIDELTRTRETLTEFLKHN
jgi:DNA-binding transcriptional MerR regulator